ncbi:response regulator [Bartonella sp. HY406]|uniref:response regulator n=1 Tax=Bartonella sp. HY406 TaxID=2979331 RepID=UPI0021C9E9FA|nr:response regulator [Bartonella sp. HY406]UXN04565.1 response regulator [Bartonella sp. HY406]
MSRDENANGSSEDHGRNGWVIFGRITSVLLILVGCGSAYYAYEMKLDPQILLAVLCAFSAIGLFFLLCTTLGVCRFTTADPRKSSVVKMLDHMPDAVVITDNVGTIRYMNSAYRQLAGPQSYTPEVLFSKNEKATQIIYKLNLAAQSDKSAYEELRISGGLGKKDEQTKSFVYGVNVSPMEVEGERFIIWNIADFTNLRDRQESLFEDLQEAIYHLDNSPAGFISFDDNGQIKYMNTTLAKWLAVDIAQFPLQDFNFTNFIGNEVFANIKETVANSNAENLTFDLELSNSSGGHIAVTMYMATIADTIKSEDKRAFLILRSKLMSDTTLPTPTSVEIENRNYLVEQPLDVFAVNPIAMAIIDSHGAIVNYNQQFLKSIPQLGENSAGLNLVSIIHPREQVRLKQILSHTISGAQNIAYLDTSLVNREDGYIRLYFSQLPITTYGTEPLFIMSVVEIAEQRALEQQVEHGQKMQAVGQLAGGIAHDFNNVLTAITMSCDLLLLSHRSSDPSHPDIMNIKNNADRAAALVQKLLAFSRRQTLRPEVLDLTDVLSDFRLLGDRLIGSTIKLVVEHGRDIWPIKGDLAELERVFMNLTTNARDAMPDGGILTIKTSNLPASQLFPYDHPIPVEQDYVLVEISDTGTGIPSEILEKIFDPFFTTKELGKGTGLGLSMVYGIISQTGGYVFCASEIGLGTKFSILLPRYIPAIGTEEEPKKLESKAIEYKSVDLSGSATVLLVEDEDAVRKGGVKALQSRGYTVYEAATGVEALEVIEECNGKIDIVVSDVVMPEMDGPSLLRVLQKKYPYIKFIFVSGYAEDAFAKNLPDDANFTFLPKPFSLKQLATAVKEVLQEDLN